MQTKLHKIFFLLSFLFAFTSFHSSPDATIKLTITNLRNNKGHVLISLFKDGVGYYGCYLN